MSDDMSIAELTEIAAELAAIVTVDGLNGLLGAPFLGELDDQTWRDNEITPLIVDELHTRALEMDRNRTVVLEQASDGALHHLIDTASAHELEARGLTVESLWHELYRRNKAQPGTPKVVCAVVCGLTGDVDCPEDLEASRACPTC